MAIAIKVGSGNGRRFCPDILKYSRLKCSIAVSKQHGETVKFVWICISDEKIELVIMIEVDRYQRRGILSDGKVVPNTKFSRRVHQEY